MTDLQNAYGIFRRPGKDIGGNPILLKSDSPMTLQVNKLFNFEVFLFFEDYFQPLSKFPNFQISEVAADGHFHFPSFVENELVVSLKTVCLTASHANLNFYQNRENMMST